MKIWKVILVALVIYSAGVVTGGLALRLTQTFEQPARAQAQEEDPAPIRPVKQRTEFLQRLDRELGLKPEQRERIEAILHESHERIDAFWEPIAPQFREEYRRVRELILAELSPEQQSQFEEHFKPKGHHRRR